MSAKKSCLIVSFGPIPTPKYQKIEGGGMRCWGLALGLKSRGYDVTIGTHDHYPVDVRETNGISLINWKEDEEFKTAINSYDVVIVNYSMGGPMTFIVDNISDHVTLILDCYVPIYIEVSARDSHDKALEYSNYSHDIIHYNKALKRGDYFLCANIPQKHLYTGALSALGIINPYSYKEERILLVPFGVESAMDVPNPRNPYAEHGVKSSDFTLLWFGGLYPWFNIIPLLETIKKLSAEHEDFKFFIVGGKNPYNTHPDFLKQYTITQEFVEKNKLESSVHFIDWVDFADRINWYKNADVVISINNVGEENIYSWRTRVMDYVWGEVPMLTNGGDPLSDSLVASSAAILLPETSEKALYSSISNLLTDKSLLKTTRTNLLKEKKKYYWEEVVAPIDEKLKSDVRPYVKEKMFVQKYKLDTIELVEKGGLSHKVRRIMRLPRKVAGIVRRKGVIRSARLVASTLRNRARKSIIKRTSKRYYFFSHPIDYTGAPMVLLDIIKDYAKNVDKKNINLVYPGGERALLNSVFKLGILTDKMVLGIGSRVIHAQLGVKKNDFVLMNTVAVYPNYRDYIFGLLETHRLKKAIWFIHEDMPEIRFEDDKGLVHRIKRLLERDLVEIIVPSQQTADDYNKFFGTTKVKSITLRVSVPEKYAHEKKASDFDTLKFVISGTPSDGRKGQLLAISAFSKYMTDHYNKAPKNYRNFELDLIAIGKNDYISQQIRSIGTGLLKDHVSFYPKVSKEEAMSITARGNVTVCSSINETFALFVAEGMLMGHVLLRNKTSGYKEQIKDGKNGYIVDTLDIDDFSRKIERLLNKKTTNEALASMSEASRNIAQKFETSDYYKQIKKLV